MVYYLRQGEGYLIKSIHLSFILYVVLSEQDNWKSNQRFH